MRKKVEKTIAGRTLSIETGELAKLSGGAVLVSYGETVILATAVAEESIRDVPFVPLTVDYREKMYAGGRIPGGFFKREGRPTEKETITCRLIDRPVRPLFPDGYRHETQIISFVLSVDQENEPDILSIIGGSAALTISDIPFHGPLGAVRIGRINGNLLVNPTHEEQALSDFNLIVAGTEDSIVMVEGGGKEVSEEAVVDGLDLAHSVIREIVAMQLELQELVGVPKRDPIVVSSEPEDLEDVEAFLKGRMAEALLHTGKQERSAALQGLLEETINHFVGEEAEKNRDREIASAFKNIEKLEARRLIIEEGRRVDGRSLDTIRSISVKVGWLPRTHGSSLFSRGETQALVVSTLGTSIDEQRIDDLDGKSTKSFMLHYNFPPFCVGEASFLRGPGRREIGHGVLAERAIFPLLPSSDEFPYTIRVVSDILESNGSSSMATVCGASLSLMDSGVPLKSPCAGIAMGLIKDNDRYFILSDITGLEDQLGDMDFKVAGTEQGITAIQMDIKCKGVDRNILSQALDQARNGRLHVLEKMNEVLPASRPELSPYAPRIITIKIRPERIRDVIGPGGKVIRSIVERTGASIDVEDDGTINIASADEEAAKQAMEIIRELTQEAEIGKLYVGTVKKIMDFGAFVEILPGRDGLVHISHIADEHIKSVSDVLKEGDEVVVKVLEIDPQGKIRLSRKEALAEQASDGGE
ncbi:MAG: polyribonucleotide nucleotidyltransferase [Nitrospinae bacterium]|nr:polyribonucleotide nucleotidyltransferase [Nitrospinota bacterium]